MDLIGLSGLITPSLSEMAFVAGELAREGFTQPLLIGGATTSRAHTAVRIAPAYPSPVVHVQDASRAVAVASSLLSDGLRPAFVAEARAAQERLRKEHADKDAAALRPARRGAPARRTARVARPAAQAHLPRRARVPAYPLEELVPRIDWTPFFQAWELKGIYPAILDDPTTGAAARELMADAQALLDDIVRNRRLEARAVLGFFPASRQGERRHRALRRREPAGGPRGDPHPPPADDQGRRPGQPRAGRLRGAGGGGRPTTSGSSR